MSTSARAAGRIRTAYFGTWPGRLRLGSPRAYGYLGLVAGTLLVWQVLNLLMGPNLMPGPWAVVVRGAELWATGELQQNTAISAQRLFLGWAIGCSISVPAALILAQIPLFRRIVDPYLNFFRFIPPIAYVSLMLIWFGVGELSKIMLIVYTTCFTVLIVTVAGALGVHKEKMWAARSLGASPWQTLWLVRMPATVPSIVTALRLSMATSFKTIVGAEMIGAKSGLGYMVWHSRAFLDFEAIFLGIAILAAMGLFADFALRTLLRPIAYRYGAAV